MAERTDLERFSEPPAPLVVVLGGEERLIRIQRKGRTAQFRKKLRACLGEVEQLGTVLQAALAAVDDKSVVSLTELPVKEILEAVLGFLGEGADEILNLIYEYDPALAESREWIEENAYDAEICAALVEVVKVVYGPFLSTLLSGVNQATAAESPAA